MLIAAAAIDIPPGRRQAVPEKVDELMLSIRELGLISPPLAYANPDVPGRFTLVVGLHRLLACLKLGLERIDVQVTDADQIHREMMEISENVHRCELSLADRDRAMRRYADLYLALHPELADVLAERKTAGLRRGAEARQVAAPPLPPPHAAVAARFGVEPAVARRALKRGEVFSDEERTVLDALKLSLHDLDEVAAVADPADRAQVIALVATNMSLADALREVLGPGGDDDAAGVPADVPAPAEPTAAEWLDSLPIRGRCNADLFDADALLYRAIQPARVAFERALSWAVRKRRIGPQGIYFRRLARCLDAPHPRQWVLCHNCDRGVVKGVGPCPVCKGGGYLIG